jgi:hypothetical protein
MKTMKPTKRIEDLDAADLQKHAVWEYANIDAAGETHVYPIKRLPVTRLSNRVVGTRVRLANGDVVQALLGNIDEHNPRLTEHFLTLSVFRANQWFTLARYHDLEYQEAGPEALARFLSLSLAEVFPIAYDIRSIVRGHEHALSGVIFREPRERLSRAEIIALAVP